MAGKFILKIMIPDLLSGGDYSYKNWGIDGGDIFFTTDGGLSWINQTDTIDNYVKNIFFLDSNTGWAVGEGGIILKTEKCNIQIIDNPEPKDFTLKQNYPNPFNPTTKIEYSIPKTSFVTLKVYDILGREVAALVNEEKSIGNYKAEFNGNNLSNGIYFYKLQAGDYSIIKKMILIK